MAKEVNEIELRESISGSEKPILIDFYATWCGPCKVAEPIFNDFSEKNSGLVEFYKADVDKNSDIAREFGIRSIPCFVLLEGGEIKNKFVGLPTEEKLKTLISNSN